MSTVRGRTLGDGSLSLAQLDTRYRFALPTATTTPKPGTYFYPISQMAVATSATLGNGTLKLAPWYLESPVTLARIAADVSVVGDVGSKVRLGIYADSGAYYPGALVVDAGQIAGDSATVQELTISQTLAAGMYWIGGAVQVVTTTQPTVRTLSSWTPPYPIAVGTSLPAGGNGAAGVQTTAVTGALPATFPAGATSTNSIPRLILKAA